MSEGASLIFSGVMSVIFIVIGFLGVYYEIRLLKNMRTMHRQNGVVVDHTVKREHKVRGRLKYYPVYEYEWKGAKKRLYSTLNAKSTIGRQVHILVDPKTENAICLEDEKSSMLVYPIFGVIGLCTFILVLVVGLRK